MADDQTGHVKLFLITLLAAWAAACLGFRLRLHRRVLVSGAPLPPVDQTLKELGGPWLGRVAVISVLAMEIWSPGAIKLIAMGFGFREVIALLVAGAFRLCSTATMWSEFRAVEDQQVYRLDLRVSLIWELTFWIHAGLNLLPTLIWS